MLERRWSCEDTKRTPWKVNVKIGVMHCKSRKPKTLAIASVTEAWDNSPLELSEGTNPAHTLISDFWPPEQ